MRFNLFLVFFVLFLIVSMTPAGAVQLQNNGNVVLKDYNMVNEKGCACQLEHDLQLLGNQTVGNGSVVTQTSTDTNNKVVSNRGLLSTDNTEGNMVISLSGSAIDTVTGKPLDISQSIPLHGDGVDWVSIVYKNPKIRFNMNNNEVIFNPTIDIEILVNGQVVLHKSVYNKYAKNVPNDWINKYPQIHWAVFEYSYLLNFHNDSQIIWNVINNDTQLNNDDKGFIRDYHTYFKDNIDLSVSYPSGSVKRNDNIYYMNGVDYMPDPKNPRLTDFELVQSFAITKQKITKDQLKYWLAEQSKYSNTSYMRAAYGTFLTALMVIKSHDQVADEAASSLDVTWSRDKYVLVMNGLTQQQTYIHTADASMGMNINASDTIIHHEAPFTRQALVGLIFLDPNVPLNFLLGRHPTTPSPLHNYLPHDWNENKHDSDSKIKAFRCACSSILSPIEDNILYSEAFPVNSVLLGTGQKLMNGTVINIEEQDTNVLVHPYNDDNAKILIDSDTLLVKEIMGPYKGSTSTTPAYCYYDLQARLAAQLGNNIVNNNCDWLGTIGGLATTIGSTIAYMTIKGTIPPDGKWKKGVLGVAIGFAGGLAQLVDSGLFEGWDPNKAAKLAVSVALSVVPLYGAEGGSVGELIISYVGKDGIKREVTHVPGNFEGYVLTTMKVRPGEAFKGGKNLEPIYVVTAQYVKYGTPEAVLKTAVGKTPKEAIREFIKSNSIQEGSNIIIDTYNPDKDKYDSIRYNNINEYLK